MLILNEKLVSDETEPNWIHMLTRFEVLFCIVCMCEEMMPFFLNSMPMILFICLARYMYELGLFATLEK